MVYFIYSFSHFLRSLSLFFPGTPLVYLTHTFWTLDDGLSWSYFHDQPTCLTTEIHDIHSHTSGFCCGYKDRFCLVVAQSLNLFALFYYNPGFGISARYNTPRYSTPSHSSGRKAAGFCSSWEKRMGQDVTVVEAAEKLRKTFRNYEA